MPEPNEELELEQKDGHEPDAGGGEPGGDDDDLPDWVIDLAEAKGEEYAMRAYQGVLGSAGDDGPGEDDDPGEDEGAGDDDPSKGGERETGKQGAGAGADEPEKSGDDAGDAPEYDEFDWQQDREAVTAEVQQIDREYQQIESQVNAVSAEYNEGIAALNELRRDDPDNDAGIRASERYLAGLREKREGLQRSLQQNNQRYEQVTKNSSAFAKADAWGQHVPEVAKNKPLVADLLKNGMLQPTAKRSEIVQAIQTERVRRGLPVNGGTGGKKEGRQSREKMAAELRKKLGTAAPGRRGAGSSGNKGKSAASRKGVSPETRAFLDRAAAYEAQVKADNKGGKG